MPGLFVTGTDTDVGKTWVTVQLLRHLAAAGARVAAMKPVASGCRATSEGLINEDSEKLLAASNAGQSMCSMTPYAFEPAIAPHIAAQHSGSEINLQPIEAEFHALAAKNDWVIIEGAGGWQVPLGADLMMADLVKRLNVPVLLVAGMRLGVINHSLLSAQAITRDGCELLGWVANHIDPHMAAREENLACLKSRMPAPYLGQFMWTEQGELAPPEVSETLAELLTFV